MVDYWSDGLSTLCKDSLVKIPTKAPIFQSGVFAGFLHISANDDGLVSGSLLMLRVCTPGELLQVRVAFVTKLLMNADL
jgi:hypothetical protein